MLRCVAAPTRIPSETGLDADELSNFVQQLSSRAEAYKKLHEFVKLVEEARSPYAAFIVAEWGEGKTSMFYGYLDKLQNVASFIVHARTVINYLDEALRGKLFAETRNSAYRLLASILAALIEEQMHSLEAKCGCRIDVDPKKYARAQQFVVDVLRTLVPSCGRRIIVFVDEVEDLVTTKNDIVNEFVAGLTMILNGSVVEIAPRGMYAGALHLIFSLTPTAYSKLKSYGELAATIARMDRRIKLIELKPLTRYEVFAFIRGVLRYMFGDNYNEVFELPTLINAIAVSTLGNPAAIQRALTTLIQLRRVDGNACGESSMPCIDSEFVVEALKGITVNIAGAKLPLLNELSYRSFEQRWINFVKTRRGIEESEARKFLRFLMANIVVDKHRASTMLNMDSKTVELLLADLNVFVTVQSLRSEIGCRRATYTMEAYPYSEELRLLVIKNLKDIVKNYILNGYDVEEIVRCFVEGSTLLDVDGEPVILLPRTEEGNVAEVRDLLMDSLMLNLDEVVIEYLANELMEGLANVKKELGLVPRSRIVISPRIVSVMYLSPELTYLDFVKDPDRRFRYWRELLANQRDEYLLLGLVAMIASMPRVKIVGLGVG